MSDSIQELRGDVAAHMAKVEAGRFDPQFLYELRQERDRQIQRWGDDHDRAHNRYDWTVFLTKFMGRAASAAMEGNDGEFERLMVKVAAVAAAARRANYPPELLEAHAQEEAERASRAAKRTA